MRRLLLISIGPVQEFIGAARTCQDLWFGSYLLSELSRAVAEELEKEGADALVFPASLRKEGEEDPGVANKILAELPPGPDPKDVASRAETALRARLEELRDEALERYDDSTKKKYVNLELAAQQIADLIELQWVSVPLPDGDAAYASAHDRAEKLLAARKNTRDWGPVVWGAAVPKASVDGLRETVLTNEASRLKGNARWKLLVKDGELLCGVGLFKRAGLEVDPTARRRPVFHSNSHVASHAARAAITRSPEALEAWKTYLNALADCGLDINRFRAGRGGPRLPHLKNPELGMDGLLLYPDRLEDVFFEGRAQEDLDKDTHQKLRGELSKVLKAANMPEANPYYAVLLADGDNLGKALHPERGGGKTRCRAIAAALDDFSLSAKKIVENLHGSLIYAGGDDVLALIPLEHALQCARELHEDFREKLQPACGHQEVPTLSAGLAIVHHLEPFGEARALAKRAEGLAKKFTGGPPSNPSKCALAVIVSKRSGPDIEVVGSFAGSDPIDKRLQEWTGHFAANEIPDKAAYALETSVAPLLEIGPRGDAPPEDLSDVAEALARVAISRRRVDGKDAIQENIRSKLKRCFGNAEKGAKKKPVAEAVRELSWELQIARTFATVHPKANERGGSTADAFQSEVTP